MPDWITDIQGYREILDPSGDPLTRRKQLQFADVTPTDDGTNTIVPGHGAPIFWSAASGPSNPTPVFLPAGEASSNATTSTETSSQIIAPRAGKVRNLTVGILGATSSATAAYTVRLNGVDSTLTCTVAVGGTASADNTHSATVAAGDRLSLKCVLGATATGPLLHRAAVEFA